MQAGKTMPSRQGGPRGVPVGLLRFVRPRTRGYAYSGELGALLDESRPGLSPGASYIEDTARPAQAARSGGAIEGCALASRSRRSRSRFISRSAWKNGATVAEEERVRAKAKERVENCIALTTFAVRVPVLTSTRKTEKRPILAV